MKESKDMNNNVNESGSKGSKKSKKGTSESQDLTATESVEMIRDRVDQAKDFLENIREKAEAAFEEKPYLVPVTAGAVGFGVGLLFGSKLVRFAVFTAVGAVMTDAIGGELKRLGAGVLKDVKGKLEEATDEVSAAAEE